MAINFQQGPGKATHVAMTRHPSGLRGFTLVELMVSTAIMLIVILVLLQVIAGMTNIWHNSTGTISTFQSARAAFTIMTRTLSRATLKSYTDYVDATGAPVTNSTVNSLGYTPIASFARASELQFTCGPTATINSSAATTIFPGDCVLFQAPLGFTNTASNKFLQRALNAVGYYVKYSALSTTGSLPPWLGTALGITATGPPPRFRLIQFTEPTENLNTYNTIMTAGSAYSGSLTYIIQASLNPQGNLISNGGLTYQTTVMAENVVLLIVRPRLEPPDEKILAGPGGSLNPYGAYSATTAGSIISPNYNYESRAWWGSYNTAPGFGVGRIVNATYAARMRNQLPPILDVAMVAVDPNSLVRFGNPVAPRTELLVQASYAGLSPKKKTPYATQIVVANPPFSNSVNMDVDLGNYGIWLADSGIRYRIFRAAVQMEGAAWVNN